MKGTFIDREEGGRDTQLIRRRDASSRGRGVWLGARRRRLGVGREDSAWIGDGQWKRRVVVRWSRSWGGAGQGFGASRGSSGSVVEVCRAEEVSARGSPETRGASGRQRGGRDLTVRDGVAADDQRHGKACVWCGTGMLPLLPQADLQGTEGGQSHAAMRGWAELQPPPQSRPEGRADLRFLNIGSRVAGQGSNVVLPLPAGGASPSCSPRHSCPLQMEESRRWARRETQGCQSCSASASRMTGAEFCSAACAWLHDSCARPKEVWPRVCIIKPPSSSVRVKLVRHCLHLAAVLNFSGLKSGGTERQDHDRTDATRTRAMPMNKDDARSSRAVGKRGLCLD